MGWAGVSRRPPPPQSRRRSPARAAPTSSAPALALICSILEILLRTATLIDTMRLMRMIRIARRMAGAQDVSAAVQHTAELMNRPVE